MSTRIFRCAAFAALTLVLSLSITACSSSKMTMDHPRHDVGLASQVADH